MSQCIVDTNLVMAEVDTLIVPFEIFGASNDDLSSPDQGVCKFRINYVHEFLGDLRVFLISPQGQSVELIGPEGNFGITQFTEWDVCFVPSTSVAVPDPGFSATWSNNQTWGALGNTYTGSYYGHAGNLEDLDSGPVNGTWQVMLIDRSIFYQGILKGLEIEFCDPDGIMCDPCKPNSIEINIPVSVACQGDPSLDFDVGVIYLNNIPDVDNYKNAFVVIDANGAIYSIDSMVNLSTAEPGSYTICGLSYFAPHQLNIFDGLAGQSWEETLDDIQNGDFKVCALTSTNCVDIYVAGRSDTSFIETSICKGESLEIGGEILETTGLHYVDMANQFGCDSTVAIQLEVIDLSGDIVIPENITCTRLEVILDASNSQYPNGSTIAWQTVDGSISDQSDSLRIKVVSGGTYVLIISYQSCSDSVYVVVNQDDDVPEVELLTDTLNCLNDSVVISSLTNARNPDFEWRLSGNLVGVENELIVSEGGQYTLIVTDENGCSGRSVVEVPVDTLPPEFNLIADTFKCFDDTILITIESDDPFVSSVWSGPGIIATNTNSARIGESGAYSVQIMGPNGCVGTQSIQTIDEREKIDFSLNVQNIDCQYSAGFISVNQGTNDLLYFWGGPNDFNSNADSITITVPGRYDLVLEDQNGCQKDTFIIISDDRDIPTFEVEVDTLGCQGGEAYISIYSDSANFTVIWIDKFGNQTTGDSLLVTEKGIYQYSLMTSNGCLIQDSVEVIGESIELDVEFEVDTLTCLNAGDATIRVRTSLSSGEYEWTGPNGFFSRGQQIKFSEGGWYHLVVRTEEECEYRDSILTPVDTLRPQVDIQVLDTLNCTTTSARINSFSNQTSLRYNWLGPNGFNSNDPSPVVDVGGIYKVSVTGMNGCRYEEEIVILQDTLRPIAFIVSDTITCLDSSAQFKVEVNTERVKYRWTDPDDRFLFSKEPIVTRPGVYLLEIIDSINNCAIYLESEIKVDTTSPRIKAIGGSLPCGGDPFQLLSYTSDFKSQFQWRGPNNFTSTERSPLVDEAGAYILSVMGKNGCVSIDTATVDDDPDKPEVSAIGGSITCLSDEVTLYGSWSQGVDSIYWYTANGILSGRRTINVDEEGEYFIVAIGANQCRDTAVAVVAIDTLGPKLRMQQENPILCDIQDVELTVNIEDLGGGRPVIQWSTIGGEILGGDQSQRLVARGNGAYFVEVINENNGCRSIDTLIVIEGRSDLRSMQLKLNHPDCLGMNDGSIAIERVIGGQGPYLFAINSSTFSNFDRFDMLASGDYHLAVKDRFGCIIDTIITLNEGGEITLDLGQDTTILLGDTIVLQAQLTPSNSLVRSAHWTPDINIDTTLGLETMVWPYSNTEYRLLIETENGCLIEDHILVRVIDETEVFIPNIFTPNGDGINDEFKLYFGKGIKEINAMEIYDRWGDKVHAQYKFEARDDFFTWDGTFDGQILPPAVFGFKLEVVKSNGQIHVIHGDITLIR